MGDADKPFARIDLGLQLLFNRALEGSRNVL